MDDPDRPDQLENSLSNPRASLFNDCTTIHTSYIIYSIKELVIGTTLELYTKNKKV